MNGSELESALAALDNMIDERNAAQQMVNILNSSVHRLTFERDELKIEAGKLKAERDEARVDACRLEAEARSRFARMSGMSCHYFSPKQIAKEREWDCFDSVPADIEAHEVRGDVAGPEGAD